MRAWVSEDQSLLPFTQDPTQDTSLNISGMDSMCAGRWGLWGNWTGRTSDWSTGNWCSPHVTISHWWLSFSSIPFILKIVHLHWPPYCGVRLDDKGMSNILISELQQKCGCSPSLRGIVHTNVLMFLTAKCSEQQFIPSFCEFFFL